MRTKEQVIADALQSELGRAEDNLNRAEHAAKFTNPGAQWYESGMTLAQIIERYQQRYDELIAAGAQPRKCEWK